MSKTYLKRPLSFTNLLPHNLYRITGPLDQTFNFRSHLDPPRRRAGLQIAKMATLSRDEKENSFVPSIDISPFLSDPNSPSVSYIVEKVRGACIKTGFFQITGHGLSEGVQKELFQASQKFFALPMDEKLKLDAQKQTSRRGYDVLASQTYHADILPDLKEVRIFPNV